MPAAFPGLRVPGVRGEGAVPPMGSGPGAFARLDVRSLPRYGFVPTMGAVGFGRGLSAAVPGPPGGPPVRGMAGVRTPVIVVSLVRAAAGQRVRAAPRILGRGSMHPLRAVARVLPLHGGAGFSGTDRTTVTLRVAMRGAAAMAGAIAGRTASATTAPMADIATGAVLSQTRMVILVVLTRISSARSGRGFGGGSGVDTFGGVVVTSGRVGAVGGPGPVALRGPRLGTRRLLRRGAGRRPARPFGAARRGGRVARRSAVATGGVGVGRASEVVRHGHRRCR